MAKSFGSLKSSQLELTDTLTFGKFATCRICDIIDDDFEYLIWLNKSGLVQYAKPVVEKLRVLSGFKEATEHYTNEIEPWESEDVPF